MLGLTDQKLGDTKKTTKNKFSNFENLSELMFECII